MTPSMGSAVPAGGPEPRGFPLKLSRLLWESRTCQPGAGAGWPPVKRSQDPPPVPTGFLHTHTYLTEGETETQSTKGIGLRSHMAKGRAGTRTHACVGTGVVEAVSRVRGLGVRGMKGSDQRCQVRLGVKYKDQELRS